LFSNAFSTGGSRPILTLHREKLALRLGIGIRFWHPEKTEGISVAWRIFGHCSAEPWGCEMEFDPHNSYHDYLLTRICQVIANPNSRRALEIVASTPQTESELADRFDVAYPQIKRALRLMTELKLVKPNLVGRRSIRIYELDGGGLRLVRSWLDRIASISDGTGDVKR
jgi:DNA-binding transcriptional ArsR family regulator